MLPAETNKNWCQREQQNQEFYSASAVITVVQANIRVRVNTHKPKGFKKKKRKKKKEKGVANKKQTKERHAGEV